MVATKTPATARNWRLLVRPRFGEKLADFIPRRCETESHPKHEAGPSEASKYAEKLEAKLLPSRIKIRAVPERTRATDTNNGIFVARCTAPFGAWN